ncbi:MAG: hypothetical protein HUJ59_03955, partial [Bacilli bacterium]|nr:hypothetical protein [Bacilli bacterium]
MGKTLKRIKIVSFILIMIQLVAITTFCVIYFNDLFQVKSNNILPPEMIASIACTLVFLDILFIWVFTIRVSSLKQKTDLHAAEVIGSDVQEAYNFAMIGLAVTNDDDTILWTNDLFKDRHIDIIDTNILEWKPDLLTLKNSSNPDAS